MILILSTFISSSGTRYPRDQREAHSRSSQGRRPSCCRMTHTWTLELLIRSILRFGRQSFRKSTAKGCVLIKAFTVFENMLHPLSLTFCGAFIVMWWGSRIGMCTYKAGCTFSYSLILCTYLSVGNSPCTAIHTYQRQVCTEVQSGIWECQLLV